MTQVVYVGSHGAIAAALRGGAFAGPAPE